MSPSFSPRRPLGGPAQPMMPTSPSVAMPVKRGGIYTPNVPAPAPPSPAQQQREQERAAREQADEARRQHNLKVEQQYASEGRATFVDADGYIRPKASDEAWKAQQETKQRNAVREADFRRSGRPYFTNKATGEVEPEQSDEVWAATQQKKATEARENARRARWTDQLGSLDAEAEVVRPAMTEAERRAAGKDLAKARREAISLNLLPSLAQKVAEYDKSRKGSTWNPFDNDPEAGAKAAAVQSRSAALSQRLLAAGEDGDPVLDEEDWKDLETANPAIAKWMRNEDARLQAADESFQKHTSLVERRRDLNLRLKDPAKWEARRMASLEAMEPTALESELERLSGEHEAAVSAYNEKIGAQNNTTSGLEGQLAQLGEENTRRLSAGVPAGDVVTFTGEDGQPQQWHRDVAAQRERLLNQMDQTQRTQREMEPGMQAAREELERDGRVLKKAAALVNARREKARQELRARDPEAADFSDEMESEAATRRADIEEMYPVDGPPRQAALAALADDLRQRGEGFETARQTQARETAEKGAALYAKFKEINDDFDFGTALKEKSPATENLLKRFAGEMGVDESTARAMLADRAAVDWSVGDQEKDVRPLSDGRISVNPKHWLDATAYEKAVKASGATPEAQAEALDARKGLAERLAANVLEAMGKNEALAPYVEKFRSATALETYEKLEAAQKEDATINRLMQRFQGGAANVGAGWMGALAGATGWKWAEQAMQYFQERAQGWEAAATLTGGGQGAQFASKVVGAIPSVLSSLSIGRLAGSQGINPIAGAAFGAGAESGGGTYANAYQAYLDQGMDAATARGKALVPAMMTGAMTALLTRIGGASGVEAVLARPGAKAAVKSTLQKALESTIGGRVLKEAGQEAWEEGFDQLWSGFVETATYNKKKEVKEVFSEALEAALIGGTLGGMVKGGLEVADATRAARKTDGQAAASVDQVHLRPEVQAAAAAEIASYQERPDVPLTKAAAMTALKIARGEFSNLTTGELEAVGLTRQDGKAVAVKARQETGKSDAAQRVPTIVEFADKEHTQPILRQEFIDLLDEHLPAVHTAIGLDEVDAREMYAELAAGKDNETGRRGDGETVDTGGTLASSATGTAAPGASRGTASPTAQQAESPKSSSTPAAIPTSEGSTTTERVTQLTRYLADRGLSEPEAAEVAGEIVRRQGVVGADYVEQTITPEFMADMKDLGVSGSFKERTLKRELKKQTNVAFSDQQGGQAASRLVHTQEIAGSNPAPATTVSADKETGRRGDGEKDSSDAAQRVPTSTGGTAPSIRELTDAWTAIREKKPAATISDLAGWLVRERGLAPKEAAQTAKGHLWGTGVERGKPDASTQRAVWKDLKAEKPEADTTDLGMALRDKLGMSKKDAMHAAAQITGGLKRADSLGTDKETGRRGDGETPFSDATQGVPVNAQAGKPVSLAEAGDAVVRALPRGERKRARTTMKYMLRALEKRGRVFEAIEFDTAAKARLGGAAIMVEEVGGKLTLFVDAAEYIRQHAWLNRSAEESTDTMVEEVIHATALHLARKDALFTPAKLRARWNSLPAALRDEVWQAYHARKIGKKARAKMPELSETEQFQMMHEFLRMLVQNKAFRGRVTETRGIDQNGLLGWIKEVLARLVETLEGMLAKAKPDVRAAVEQYRDKIMVAMGEVSSERGRRGDDETGRQVDNLAAVGDGRGSVVKAAASSDATQVVPTTHQITPDNAVLGGKGVAYTDGNDAIEYQWAAVEVSDLVISNDDAGRVNPVYPQALQPRDRSSAGSEAQVNDIARNANLSRLSHAAGVGDGAPVVAPEDAVVESGNGRGMGVRRAYTQGLDSAAAYRAALLERAAEFGLDKSRLDKMRQPVLVRLRLTPVDRAAFTLAANVSTIAPKREIETAKSDARQIVPDLFEGFAADEDGEIYTASNAGFIRAFVRDIVPPAERPAVIDAKGNLSQSGLRRVRNALFVYAYGSSPEALNALGTLTEAIDASGRNLASALLAVAPRFAGQNARIEAGALYPLSITGDLVESVQTLGDLRRRGEKVSDFLAQDYMPGITDGRSALGDALLGTLESHKRSPRKLLELLNAYATAVEKAGDPRQASMFGDDRVSKEELWELVSKNVERAGLAAARKSDDTTTGDLFATTPVTLRTGAPSRDAVLDAIDSMEDFIRREIKAAKTPEARAEVAEKHLRWTGKTDPVNRINYEGRPGGLYVSAEGREMVVPWKAVAQIAFTTETGGEFRTTRQATPADGRPVNIQPVHALKAYRKLKQIEAERGVLEGTQAAALERAERALGQVFMDLGDARRDTFSLEAESTKSDAAKGVPTTRTEQMALLAARKAEEKGFVAFDPALESLGIPRAEMPQVPTAARGALARFLVARGIPLKLETVDAATLKPTQAEFSPEKVKISREKIEQRRILVSADGYVLDGHHQWMVAREDGKPAHVVRLMADVKTALAALDAFPSTLGGKPGGTRYEDEEYQYLGAASENWRTSDDPEAKIVNPIDPDLSPDAKVDALNALSRANVPLVERILQDINRRLRLEGKYSIKLPQRIQAKASRPIIREEKPWHDIEHIRDGLRFKVKLDEFRKMPAIVAILRSHGIEVVKFDHKKMFAPKAWGWRFVAWDMRLPNGQLVEFYATVPELDTKEVKGPNHALFEKWRNVAPPEAGTPWFDEMMRDIDTSSSRYTDAFMNALRRMNYASESAALASWERLVTRAESVTLAKLSMSSTAEGAGDLRQAPSLPLRAPGGETNTSPESLSNATDFTVEDSTDRDWNQQKGLFAARKADDPAQPDLFAYNNGLGLEDLLTPAQQEAKLQQAEQLSLFTNATTPRPTARRPARPAATPRTQATAEPAGGLGELFAQPGMGGKPADAGGAGGQRGGGGTRQPDTAGTGTTGGTGTDDGAGNESGDGAGSTGARSRGATANTPAAEPAAVAAKPDVFDLHAEARPATGTPARNFEPPADLGSLAPAGAKAKIRANIQAIQLLKTLEGERRNPSPEEKRTLAAYTGWGAFKEAFNDGMADSREFYRKNPHYLSYNKAYDSWERNWGELHDVLKKELSEEEYRAASRSTLNAHYTAAPFIRAMWKMVERLGFKGGRALEPSAGNGHFIGLQPQGKTADRTQWQSVELDEISARLLSKLYPEVMVNESAPNQTREVNGLGFERARIPNGSLDLVISNVPFHESGPKKKGFPNLNLHNFFFAHAMDKVKPGGLVAFITSSSTMQNNQKQRDFIASKGDLVAAFRLPNNAFKENAGTEVVTDIIILRKPDGSLFRGYPWKHLVEVGRQVITLTQGKDQLADELRREAAANGKVLREYSKDGVKAIDVDAPILVNQYFATHPHHVLGTHSLQGSMYRGNEYTVTAPSDMNVAAALEALVPELPADIMGTQAAEGADRALAESGDRPFSFVERDGKIWEVQDDGMMLEAEWGTNPALVRSFRSWHKVKEAARQLIEMENDARADDEALEVLRRELNRVYDSHIAEFGAISKRFGNKHAHLYSDPEYPLTAALESEKMAVNASTGKKTYSYAKAAIMKQRVVKPISEPTTATDIQDAIEKSFAWRGMIAPQFMAPLLRLDMDGVHRLLDAQAEVFENPESSTYEHAEVYLTGNIRAKLAAAESAAEDDPKFRKNVDALTKAMPERRSIGVIKPVLGARWVPAQVYNAFIREVLQGRSEVEYIQAANTWRISDGGGFRNPDFDTAKMGGEEILKTLLEMKEPIIHYTDRDGKKHFDAKATMAAKSAATKMKRAFVEFVKTSTVELPASEEGGEARPVWQVAEDAYNETQNNYVTPKHRGDYLQFPGLSEDVWRTPHRRAVIARFLAERRGMMAHGVGSGKTFNQIILSKELRRLGLAKKPLIVVQNSTLGQFAASYLQAYPSARILVPTERDLQTQNRRKLVSKIATGSYDAVILSHSQFDLISNKPESVREYMGEKVDELKGLILASKGGDKSKVRDLEGMLKRLEDRLAGMLDSLKGRQDSTIFFEDLGVDALIVDEAHNYKSVPIVTRMGRVKGVPAGADSQRAIGMLLKARHVQEKTGGKNVFLATGTPVKNSMAEAYIMMELMAPDILRDYRIYNFDDFATTYGEIVSSTEISWSGAPKVESRFAKFQNGRELLTMIRSAFDVAMGNESLGLKVPKVKGGAPSLDIVPATETIHTFNAWVRTVAERWKTATGQEKEEFTAVPIMTLQAGIVAALDPRLISSSVPDHAESKVNTAIRDMLRIYKEGKGKRTTQLVFADLRRPFDMSYLTRFAGHPFHSFQEKDAVVAAYESGEAKGDFDLYEDIKRKLIAGGVKESEILLMDPSMSKAKRTAMFEKVSSGDIRIAIGSTETLGVGVNVQERLAALHHLMPPRDFTPAMHEQRNGRAIRQGNLHYDWNEEIEIRQWGTEGSMDSAVYGTLGRKQRFITQLLMGDVNSDTFDDPTDPIAVNLAEMAARTMGDKDFIRRVELEKEIRDLRLEAEAFNSELAGRRSRLNQAEYLARVLPADIAKREAALSKLGDIWVRTAPRPEGVKDTTDISDKPVYEFGDRVIDTAGKEGAITTPLALWLLDQSQRAERQGRAESDALPLKINGHTLDVRVQVTMPGGETPGTLFLDGQRVGSFNGAAGLLHTARGLKAGLESAIATQRRQLDTAKSDIQSVSALLEREGRFARSEELAALEREMEDVDARLAEKAAPKDKAKDPAAEAQRAEAESLPEMKAMDTDLLSAEVEGVLENAWVIGNRLFLPDNLDRKTYLRVDDALQSVGGQWNKRAKAHVFRGDPRPFIPVIIESREEADTRGAGGVFAAPKTDDPNPLARLGFNHLDKAVSAKVAAHTRWAREGVGETVAGWARADAVAPFVKIAGVLKGELMPDSVLPREVMAKKREMDIAIAMGQQKALDLTRAMSGKPKFSDLAYPRAFVENPAMRERLFDAMEGRADMASLPPEMQALGAKLRGMLVQIGQEAVKQGRMNVDTFEGLRENFMPRFTRDEAEAKAGDLWKRFKLGVKDILQQRTTAFHIVDSWTKDPRRPQEFKTVAWDEKGRKWRFRDKQHRDAFFQTFIRDEALRMLQQGGPWVTDLLAALDSDQKRDVRAQIKALTREAMDKPAAMSPALAGVTRRAIGAMAQRYGKKDPIVPDKLVRDPVYAIARYAAQMTHDNATAAFFNYVLAGPNAVAGGSDPGGTRKPGSMPQATNNPWISDVAAPGFRQIPENDRFGRLSGKWVEEGIANQVLELVHLPSAAMELYDTILSWWKTGKTVLNPGTHVRNLLGNLYFSQLAGNSVPLINPGNLPYYTRAARALRDGGADYEELYAQGVLGADYASTELRGVLRGLVPAVSAIEENPGLLTGIGKSLGRLIPRMVRSPVRSVVDTAVKLYQLEDDIYKAAAFFKAKAMILSESPDLPVSESSSRAAAHVRKWFPYYDKSSSGTLRALGRTAMPFLGFYRESLRIFGHAVQERPLSLAGALALPSLVTMLSVMLLGLDERDEDEVKKDMRGKGGKLGGLLGLSDVPVFSMLLPARTADGALQQFDLSAVHPFADFLGRRVEFNAEEGWWQGMWRHFIAAGPLASLAYSQMTGRDAFGDRPFVEDNMTDGEKVLARLDNAVKIAAPPLFPGGTGWQTLASAGERQTNKTFETRDPVQAVSRAVAGVDVRGANPNLYRLAEDWRAKNGLPAGDGADYGTTPVSRARKALFATLAQDTVNPTAVRNVLKFLKEKGQPINSAADVKRLLALRNPLEVIRGKEHQEIFRASLTGESRRVLEEALAEFRKIEAKAPGIILSAMAAL